MRLVRLETLSNNSYHKSLIYSFIALCGFFLLGIAIN